jgi:hypothetical protein
MMDGAESQPVKCANCGASEFQWGWVHVRGNATYELYPELDEGLIFGIRGRSVKARRCLSCNHLALFCDPDRRPLIALPRYSLRMLLLVIGIAAVVFGAIAAISR